MCKVVKQITSISIEHGSQRELHCCAKTWRGSGGELETLVWRLTPEEVTIADL